MVMESIAMTTLSTAAYLLSATAIVAVYLYLRSRRCPHGLADGCWVCFVASFTASKVPEIRAPQVKFAGRVEPAKAKRRKVVLEIRRAK